MNNDSKEENPDWNRFWSYNPSADNPHEFGECMENWHDYEWRKEQEERWIAERKWRSGRNWVKRWETGRRKM